MARRRLMSDATWAETMALATEERDLMRHYVLSADDLSALSAKRNPANRLGQALLLCAMRHPGRALGPEEVPPAATLAFVAEQVDVDPAVFYRHRPGKDEDRPRKHRLQHPTARPDQKSGDGLTQEKRAGQPYGPDSETA